MVIVVAVGTMHVAVVVMIVIMIMIAIWAVDVGLRGRAVVHSGLEAVDGFEEKLCTP